VSAIQKVFRIPILSGKLGRPHLRAWENLCIVRVIKQVNGKRVAGVIQRIACGRWTQACLLLKQTQNSPNAHTAYIERMNGTFRSRITALVRRGRSPVRQLATLHHAMYLVQYTISAIHKSLRRELYVTDTSHRWIPMTPAMVIGITVFFRYSAERDWTVRELLSYQVPLPPWKLPRGRPSKRIKEPINRWNL